MKTYQGEVEKRKNHLIRGLTTPNIVERQITSGGRVARNHLRRQKRMISIRHRVNNIPRKLPNPLIFVQGKDMPSNDWEELSDNMFLLNKEMPLPSKVPIEGVVYPPIHLSHTPLRVISDCKQPREPILKGYTPNLSIHPKICLKL